MGHTGSNNSPGSQNNDTKQQLQWQLIACVILDKLLGRQEIEQTAGIVGSEVVYGSFSQMLWRFGIEPDALLSASCGFLEGQI